MARLYTRHHCRQVHPLTTRHGWPLCVRTAGEGFLAVGVDNRCEALLTSVLFYNFETVTKVVRQNLATEGASTTMAAVGRRSVRMGELPAGTILQSADAERERVRVHAANSSVCAVSTSTRFADAFTLWRERYVNEVINVVVMVMMAEWWLSPQHYTSSVLVLDS